MYNYNLTNYSATVIAHLPSELLATDCVSYFFCRYDDLESLTIRIIIGSIARQLLSDQQHEMFTKLDQDIRESKPDTDWISDMLKRTLSTDRQYFVILDGLDECEDTEAHEVVRFLESLLVSPNLRIKLFYSSQATSSKFSPLSRSVVWHIPINHENIAPDLEYYIDSSLEQRLESGSLRLGDPNLILSVQQALKEGAQGMYAPFILDKHSTLTQSRFLWVIFQIENVCAQQTDEEILEAIKDLPRGLPMTFERILKKLSLTKNVRYASRIFDWLSVAKRPLTLEELREAIAIEPLQKELITSRLVNDIWQTLSCCGCLVTIDEEQGTVHFAHHSVHRYIMSSASDPSLADYHVDLEAADAMAGEICITYLNFEVPDRHIAQVPPRQAKIVDIPTAIIQRMLPQTALVSKMTALKLLKGKEGLNGKVQRQMAEVASGAETVLQQHHFLPYAKKWWVYHSSRVEPRSRYVWELWCHILTDENKKAEKPWLVMSPEKIHGYDANQEMGKWAIANNHGALLIYLLQSDNHFLQEPYDDFPFNENLKVRDIVFKLVDHRSWTALHHILEKRSQSSALDHFRTDLLVPAILDNQLQIVQICLTDGADVYVQHRPDGFPAYGVAAVDCSLNTPKMVQQYLPDFKKWPNMLDSWSPLAVAVVTDNAILITYIISKLQLVSRDSKVQFSASSSFSQALLVAAAFGHFRIMYQLLQLEYTVCTYNDEEDNALREVLVRQNFPVNLTDRYGWTALMYVTAWGHLDLVKILLQRRADPEIGVNLKESDELLTPVVVAGLINRKDIHDVLCNLSRVYSKPTYLKDFTHNLYRRKNH